MPIPSATASSPPGSAGGGLAGAFNAAVAELQIEDDDGFHAAAGDPEPQTEAPEQPETETAEPATPQAKPNAQPVKPTGKAEKPGDPARAPQSQPGPLAAPANWDAQRKEAFGKLTPEAQKVLLDMSKGMESEYGRKSQELAGKTRFADQVSAIVTDDHKRQMAAGGFKSVTEGLSHLVKLNDWASNDFPGYARWAVTQFGGGAPIADTLRQLFPEAFTGSEAPQGGPQPAPQWQAPDPLTRQVYDTVRALTGKVEGLEQRHVQTVTRSADVAIQRFKDAKDESGNPKYPHLGTVEGDMIGLLTTPQYLQIEDYGDRLVRAYEAAVAMNPEIRQQLIDSDVQRRLAEQTKAADLAKAKRARAPINSPPTGPSGTRAKGIDGALRSAMNLHGV